MILIINRLLVVNLYFCSFIKNRRKKAYNEQQAHLA